MAASAVLQKVELAVATELATLHLRQSDAKTEDDQVIWVRLHLEHLADNLAEIVEPAQAVAG